MGSVWPSCRFATNATPQAVTVLLVLFTRSKSTARIEGPASTVGISERETCDRVTGLSPGTLSNSRLRHANAFIALSFLALRAGHGGGPRRRARPRAHAARRMPTHRDDRRCA